MAQETKYYLYYLYDPRNGTVCYVGVTNNFKTRLRQHCSPKPTLQTKVAKFQRYLTKIGKKLTGKVVLETSNKDFVSFAEWVNIKRLVRKYGKKQIKNTAEGGYSGYKLTESSIEKMKRTRKLNGKQVPNGESAHTSKLKESEVLEIYKLINKFYSNGEIEARINNAVGKTAIQAIRDGSNWNQLWNREGMEFIPSLFTISGGISSVDKLKMLIDISNNMTNDDISKKYLIPKTDAERVRTKFMWKPVWGVYEKYIKNNFDNSDCELYLIKK